MIRVHHLDYSRSFRILWLLEELELPYELVEHWRDKATRLSPPSLQALHPLGKAPLIEDPESGGGRAIHESGAIIDYVIRRHGGGRLAPPADTSAYDDYQMWLHYAEGSAMLPIMLDLYIRTRGTETPAIRARIDDELARHLGFVDASLAGRDFLVGDGLTGADIQMSFVAEIAARLPLAARLPALVGWSRRLTERPAYARAVAKGGASVFPAAGAAATRDA